MGVEVATTEGTIGTTSVAVVSVVVLAVVMVVSDQVRTVLSYLILRTKGIFLKK